MAFTFIEERNVIVMGKVGTGKSTVINNIVGKEIFEARFSYSRVTREIGQIAGKLELEEAAYMTNFIDTIGLADDAGTVSLSSDNFRNPDIMVKINDAIKCRFKNGVSLVIVVLNMQSYTKDDKDMFKALQNNFKPLFWKLAVLVFTHCDGMDENAVKKRIECFREDEETKDIAAKFEDRIITVGFPPIKAMKADLKESYKTDIKRDVAKLHEHLRKANKLHPYEELAVPAKSCCII